MQMSRDLFLELLKSLNQATSDRRDRRQSARLSVVATTTVMRLQTDGKAIALVAAIRDVSSRGIGVVLQSPLELGDLFYLRLQQPDNPRSTWIACKVVRRQPHGRRCFVGACYASIQCDDRGEGPVFIEPGQPKTGSGSPVILEKRRRSA